MELGCNLIILDSSYASTALHDVYHGCGLWNHPRTVVLYARTPARTLLYYITEEKEPINMIVYVYSPENRTNPGNIWADCFLKMVEKEGKIPVLRLPYHGSFQEEIEKEEGKDE